MSIIDSQSKKENDSGVKKDDNNSEFKTKDDSGVKKNDDNSRKRMIQK